MESPDLQYRLRFAIGDRSSYPVVLGCVGFRQPGPPGFLAHHTAVRWYVRPAALPGPR
jgi:hypothetical protein